MISTLLIALAAMAVAVAGCVLVGPTRWVIEDRDGANDDAL